MRCVRTLNAFIAGTILPRTPLNHWGTHRLGHEVVARANGQEITRVLSERVSAHPSEMTHAGPALVHLFDKDIGQRLN